MSVFVDTPALMAVIVASDKRHGDDTRTWAELMAGDEVLFTSNHAPVEVRALLQHRHGIGFVRRLQAEAVPALRVMWVTAEQHAAAFSGLLAASRRDLSLVDCASFVLMRELAIARASALDPHFAEHGFDVV